MVMSVLNKTTLSKSEKLAALKFVSLCLADRRWIMRRLDSTSKAKLRLALGDLKRYQVDKVRYGDIEQLIESVATAESAPKLYEQEASEYCSFLPDFLVRVIEESENDGMRTGKVTAHAKAALFDVCEEHNMRVTQCHL